VDLITSRLFCVTLWRPAAFGDIKKTPKRTWLCTGISLLLFGLQLKRLKLVEASKDAASLLVCTRKKYFCLGACGFFVSDVISGGLLGHLGSLCLALGANH